MDELSKKSLPGNNASQKLNKLLDEALLYEPEAAYLYNAKGLVNVQLKNTTIAIQFFQKALQYSPTWDLPKENIKKYSQPVQNKEADKLRKASKKFIVGINAGLNLSKINLEKTGNTDNKTGFHAGALFQFNLSENITLNPQINYSQQGGEQISAGATTKDKYSFDYIDMTLILKYLLGKKISIDVGPQLGYLLSAKRDINNRPTDIKSLYSSTNISFAAGLSYLIKSGFGVQAKYISGLKSIAKENTTPSAKLSSAQAGIFYLFTK
jgi:tetratricopeptide (TPR) repeat protein